MRPTLFSTSTQQEKTGSGLWTFSNAVLADLGARSHEWKNWQLIEVQVSNKINGKIEVAVLLEIEKKVIVSGKIIAEFLLGYLNLNESPSLQVSKLFHQKSFLQICWTDTHEINEWTDFFKSKNVDIYINRVATF